MPKTIRSPRVQPEWAVKARNSLGNYYLSIFPGYEPVRYQQREVIPHLEAVERGEIPRLMIFMPPGHLLADETVVPTLTGWREHGDLNVGDHVYGCDGWPTRIRAISDSFPADCRITLSDGTEFYSHENHEWTVFDRTREAWRTLSTSYFLRQTKFQKPLQLISGGRGLYQFPRIGAVQRPQADLPVHPYVMGAWLGDGSSNGPKITYPDKDAAIMDRVKACGYRLSAIWTHKSTGVHTATFAGIEYRYHGSPLWNGLKRAGVANNKHIPDLYKNASVNQRLELLAGLVDTDGYKDIGRGRYRIVTTNKRLADDIADVVRSLGWRPCISVGKLYNSPGATIISKQTPYYVGFCPSSALPVVVERKRLSEYAIQRRTVTLAEVEKVVPRRKGHCIEVEAADGLYLVGEHYTPTHNSKTEMATKAFIPWYLSRNAHKNAILACHTDPLARDFGSIIRDTMQNGVAHKQIFPEVIVSPSNKAANFFRTNRGNAFYAFGMDGGVTGRRADLLLIDDPIESLQDALSDTVQTALHNTYKAVLKDRLRPNAAIVFCMTRWATRDLAARILEEEGDRWQVLVLPAQTHDASCTRPMDCQCPFLWESYYGRRHYEDFKSDAYIWEAKWQQAPHPALNQGFEKEWLRFWLPLGYPAEYRDDPHGGAPIPVALPTDHHKLYKYNAYIIVDPAMGKSAAHDRTAMLVLIAGPETRLFLVDAILDRLDPGQRIEAFIKLFRLWKPKQVLWEEYALAADTFWLEKTLREQGIRQDELLITSVGRKAIKGMNGGRLSKDDRIMSLGSDFKANRIWLPKKMVRRCVDGSEIDIINYFINREYLPWAGEGSIAHDDMLDCLARIHDPDAFFEHAERPDDDRDDDHEYNSSSGGGTWESRY